MSIYLSIYLNISIYLSISISIRANPIYIAIYLHPTDRVNPARDWTSSSALLRPSIVL